MAKKMSYKKAEKGLSKISGVKKPSRTGVQSYAKIQGKELKQKPKSRPGKTSRRNAKKARPATIVNKKGKTVKNTKKNRKKSQIIK